jgi:hypothetical protein
LRCTQIIRQPAKAGTARAVQERMEEKALGTIPPEHQPSVQRLPLFEYPEYGYVVTEKTINF